MTKLLRMLLLLIKCFIYVKFANDCCDREQNLPAPSNPLGAPDLLLQR